MLDFGRHIARFQIMAFLAAILPLCLASESTAYSFKTLYSFCSEMNCSDGNTPLGSLTQDNDGNLYGTTNNGGNFSSNAGTIFELVHETDGSWSFKTLYRFCSSSGLNCPNGAFPQTDLVIDTSGNLYGTTFSGGKNGDGVVFELERISYRWKIKRLHSFCSRDECVDGTAVYAGLTYVGKGSGSLYNGTAALYGVTQQGGKNKEGTAYALVPINGEWKYHVIHSFCSLPGCTDGAGPIVDLTADDGGNLYGTTQSGNGTLFQLSSPDGMDWDAKSLYVFCAKAKCSDGMRPSASVVLDRTGNLSGSAAGGAGESCPKTFDSCGVVFQFAASSENPSEKVLCNFCMLHRCADGAFPLGLTVDRRGAIFGMTVFGGRNHVNRNGDGTVFEIKARKESVLYDFCSQTNCTDGETPHGALIEDASGNLYGMTAAGGAHASGTIFELVQ